MRRGLGDPGEGQYCNVPHTCAPGMECSQIIVAGVWHNGACVPSTLSSGWGPGLPTNPNPPATNAPCVPPNCISEAPAFSKIPSWAWWAAGIGILVLVLRSDA